MGRGPACNDELWDFTTETDEIVLSSGESQAGQHFCRAARHKLVLMLTLPDHSVHGLHC